MLLSDLQTKDIVNVTDGKNVGNIIDVKIDESGNIAALIVEPSKNFFRAFNKDSEMIVKWQDISKIGEDVILVKTTF